MHSQLPLDRVAHRQNRPRRSARPVAVGAAAIVTLVIASLFGSLVFASPAQAQTLPTPGAQTDDPTVAGAGRLRAVGTGHVEVDMAGRLVVRVDGDVRIVDHTGDMAVRIAGGSSAEERSSDVSLDGFRGTVVVRGSGFSVTVDGQVVLTARGRGQADLTGQGWYQANRGDRMPWDGRVAIGEPQLTSAEAPN